MWCEFKIKWAIFDDHENTQKVSNCGDFKQR